MTPEVHILPFDKEDTEGSVPARFERVVAWCPDRLAVKDGELCLSYDALNRAANRTARAILEACGQEGAPVALLLRHGAPAIVGILSVLKSGRAFSVLDPTHPVTRLGLILDDLQPAVILSRGDDLKLAEELAHGRCRVLDAEEIGRSLCSSNLSLALAPQTISAVLYTSGSTGVPKGVERNHRIMLHRVWHGTHDRQITAEDRWGLLGSTSFGTAVTDTVCALLNGASLHLFDAMSNDLDKLASWLLQEEITCVQPPIALLRNLLDTLPTELSFPKLRLVVLVGQALHRADVEALRRHLPRGSKVIHRLGITEAGAISLQFLRHDTPISGRVVPAGYAVADKEVLILDDAGQTLGFDEVGEIAVRSRYLAPGYWRRPDLTLARFLPDPEGGDRRIYLTGDLGRMRSDGLLEHLGRRDFQVKIRGYRVEIGEVEAALQGLEAVKDAVVVAHEAASGNRRLVSYVIPADGARPTTSELRRQLSSVLPDYMIPAAYVLMDSLPLTATGKIDRRRLPEASTSRPELDQHFVSPRTPRESKLAALWSEVLNIEPVGIHDHFFELGGQSLLAARIVSRIRTEIGEDCSLRQFLNAPTVAALAANMLRDQRTGEGDSEGATAETDLARARRLLERF